MYDKSTMYTADGYLLLGSRFGESSRVKNSRVQNFENSRNESRVDNSRNESRVEEHFADAPIAPQYNAHPLVMYDNMIKSTPTVSTQMSPSPMSIEQMGQNSMGPSMQPQPAQMSMGPSMQPQPAQMSMGPAMQSQPAQMAMGPSMQPQMSMGPSMQPQMSMGPSMQPQNMGPAMQPQMSMGPAMQSQSAQMSMGPAMQPQMSMGPAMQPQPTQNMGPALQPQNMRPNIGPKMNEAELNIPIETQTLPNGDLLIVSGNSIIRKSPDGTIRSYGLFDPSKEIQYFTRGMYPYLQIGSSNLTYYDTNGVSSVFSQK